jgi:hypothetical protein
MSALAAMVQAAHVTLWILLINSILPAAAWAVDPYYLPASPLQPVGQPKADPLPRPAQNAPIPYVAPAEPAPAPSASPKPELPLLGCTESCAKGRVENVSFELRGGRIGAESLLHLSDGDSLEVLAFSEVCPREEGKKTTLAPESVPDGCIFFFMIPTSRASVAPGSKLRKYGSQRCLGGKMGMSEFRCDETTLAPGSIGPPELSREQD